MNNDQTPKNPQHDDSTDSVIGSVAADIRTAATHKFDEAIMEARAKADDAKTDVAGEVKDVAMALRRASEELRGGSAQERTLGKVASGLADVSDSIRDKDLGEILQMVSKVGRENPILFLGGAALLGFTASRYAKATAGETYTQASQDTSDKAAQVGNFLDEGNPNTQPMGAPS